MKQIFLIILISSYLIINNGCSTKTQIPESIFNNVKIFEQPKEAKDKYDIYKSYIDLYNIYNNNLIILNSIKNINKL